VRAYGGGAWKVLRKVQLLFRAARLAHRAQDRVPAAILGTVIGEFMGQERGLGAALVVAEQSSDVVRTWGITVVCSLSPAQASSSSAPSSASSPPWATTTLGATA